MCRMWSDFALALCASLTLSVLCNCLQLLCLCLQSCFVVVFVAVSSLVL